MSSDSWPPNNPCSPATKWRLSIDSGSQLQVAKLAEMCPVAPNSTQRHPNGAERCRTVPNGGERCRMVANGAKWCRTVPNSAEWCQHPDGALCSNKIILEPIIFFFHLFYILLNKGSASDRCLEAPKRPWGPNIKSFTFQNESLHLLN